MSEKTYSIVRGCGFTQPLVKLQEDKPDADEQWVLVSKSTKDEGKK